ncbi:MAG: hypothetical protein JWM76_2624 [Pseudonocardiales bacterium]|nr:hypothetical protein [Pseudonocardiales bacterium]
MRNAVLIVAVIGAVTGALVTGCTSSKRGAAKSSATTAAASTTPFKQFPLITGYANDPLARKNVVQTKCGAITGGWEAGGTVNNPSTAAVTYTIVVYFTTQKSTAQASQQAVVPVPAGATVPWSTNAQFIPADDPMLCTMVGVGFK